MRSERPPEMEGQMDVFEVIDLVTDEAESERRKQQGIARANENVSSGWARDFDAAVEHYARLKLPFTSEDVLALVGLPPGNPNAVGARMNASARKGLIRRVGIRKGRRASAHARNISEWVGVA